MGRRFTILVAAFVALAGSVLAGCVPGGPGAPLTTVVPAHNLRDGAMVTVTGTNFPAKTDVVVVQCSSDVPTPDNCDLNSVQFLTTDGAGTVSTRFIVARKLINGIGDEFDCAVPGTCVMAVTDLDVTTFDSSPIDFNPSLPLAKPLQFSVSIANDGLVFEKEGIALLHGQLTCNRAAFLEIDGRLSQAFGRFLFRTDFSTFPTCTGAGTFGYSFFVPPDNGLYAAGPANIRFEVFGVAGDSSFAQAQTSHGLTLTKASEPTAAVRAEAQANATRNAAVKQVKAARAPRSGTHW